jgi:nitroimidazol reductase NimA-like FMN-containing flavoprotein (pyridoxamine 5'-phosphate oxidase superfamily)
MDRPQPWPISRQAVRAGRLTCGFWRTGKSANGWKCHTSTTKCSQFDPKAIDLALCSSYDSPRFAFFIAREITTEPTEKEMPALSDWMQQTLEARHYATLATHNEDGSIHLTPVWYLFENGKFYVGSASSSRKARNVTARPNATLMVDIRQPGGERCVYASGHVETLRGNESREINSKILHRYLTEGAVKDSRIGPAFAAADDITICLIPERWRSWSLMEMDEQFFGGILTSTPEEWFRPIDN